MPRVTIEHVEISKEAERVSVTGTVDDSPAAASFRLIKVGTTLAGYKKMSNKEREQLLAEELVKGKKARAAVPGKRYIEVEE